MTRQEFLRALEQDLADVSAEERAEAVRFYGEYFDEAGPEREQALLEELGDAHRVANIIRANMGVAGIAAVGADDDADADGDADCDEGAGEEAGAPAGAGAAQSAGGEGSVFDRAADWVRRQPNGVLWVLLAVVTCPVWLGLLSGLIGLVMGVFGALAGVTGAGVAAAVAGALHAASGVVLLAASPMDALVRLGGGLFCVGLGILMTGGGVWLITKAVRAGIALWQRAARLWRGKAVR